MARAATDTTLGNRYRLLRLIASGGMGSVWEAEDSVLHRRVAVKLLSDALASDERFVERFRREARAVAGLSHPNIAGVFDYGEEGATHYIVMELVQGETLSRRLAREGRMEPAEAARIGGEVADALQAAHEAGIVHRDVKPANVMLTRRGNVKVLDFGIAAALREAPLTTTASAMGTPTYISPEQARGQKATAASDLYSLGVVLYEMVTGRPPFSAESPVAVAMAHIQERPRPLEDVAPSVPPQIAAVCARAMEKDPAARPASAAEFAAMLRGEPPLLSTAAGRPPVAAAPGATAPLPPPADTAVLTHPSVSRPTRVETRRRGWPWLLAGVALALVLLGAVFAPGLLNDRAGERRSANEPRAAGANASPTAGGVEVPVVQGLRLVEARRVLARHDLRVGDREFTQGRPWIVVSSEPAAGTTVDPGTAVTLFVGAPLDEREGGGPGSGEQNGEGGGNDKDKDKDKDKGNGGDNEGEGKGGGGNGGGGNGGKGKGNGGNGNGGNGNGGGGSGNGGSGKGKGNGGSGNGGGGPGD